ncbi:chloride channel protein [Flexibacter flexilis]|uniref:chloride channel protein n=1 Tax=Flexibacter flexilis TaxID=998 RepID=UPI001FE236A5|nr:chloride channel protein [Flexibacter flexilis]
MKREFDKINNENLKKNILNALPFWVAALVTGGIAVLYAKLFAWAEHATQLLYEEANWAFFIITPLCFVVSWWLVDKYSPFARGSGIPQVSAAIELANPKQFSKVNALLGFRVLVVKIVSSLIAVIGGGVVGREGPTIQIAASVFKKVNDWLPAWYPKISKRNMIITGAAAGLASAFNTPLGGIVFAIEELTKTHFNFFKSALLTGVIIAGLTALSLLGPYLYLGYPQLSNFGLGIIFSIIPLAVVTGLAGSGMGEIILYILRQKKQLKTKWQNIAFICVCGLAMAGLAVLLDGRAFGSGKEIMVSTLFSNHKYLEWYVPLMRILGSILTFPIGGAGGIFAPSLGAGASIGAVLAGWLELSATESNLLILCGMTGFLTSITRSPFTSSILVLEMTNSHNVIFYIMLTALIANLVGNFINKHSFYDTLKEQYLAELEKEEATHQPPK